MGFTPSVGEEIQTEYLVPRAHAAAAIEAVRALGDAIRPALQVTEIRTVAADRLWMSPQHGRDTVGIHFTWKREPELVGRLIAALEVALAPFAPRPHWGKLFLAGAATIADRYERLPDFGSSPSGSTRAARSATTGSSGTSWASAASPSKSHVDPVVVERHQAADRHRLLQRILVAPRDVPVLADRPVRRPALVRAGRPLVAGLELGHHVLARQVEARRDARLEEQLGRALSATTSPSSSIRIRRELRRVSTRWNGSRGWEKTASSSSYHSSKAA